MYRLMVELLIFFFFTVWNVAESLAGLVREPMAEDKIFSSSSSSALLRMLCRPTISEIYVSSKRDFRKAIFWSGVVKFNTNGRPPYKIYSFQPSCFVPG